VRARALVRRQAVCATGRASTAGFCCRRYFATHFYFSTYHVLGNLPLRYLRTAYATGPCRTALQIGVVLAMSYTIAFMETFTISNFPYYSFEDRGRAYTVGSRLAHASAMPLPTCLRPPVRA